MNIIAPYEVDEAWSLVSKEETSELDLARVRQQARTFFSVETLVVERTGDELAIVIVDTRVAVRTCPIAEAALVVAAAERGVRAIGGAGFDVLVGRGKRIWQVRERVDGGDPRAPLVVAAVLASILLAPIVPPREITIFGVRGARVRLEALDWPAPLPRRDPTAP